MRILVVEDEVRLARHISRAFTTAGHDALVVHDGEVALREAQRSPHFDLIVLDVMLPTIDGFEVLKRLRKAHIESRVLVLTARGELSDRVSGLALGADDYLAKPFETRELILRLSNILKRATPAEPAEASAPAEAIRFGPFIYRFDRGELRVNDEVLRITDREREILNVLGQKAGANVAREELAGASGANERTVDVQITRLRRKIEADPANPVYLQTVRGVGYRLLVEQ